MSSNALSQVGSQTFSGLISLTLLFDFAIIVFNSCLYSCCSDLSQNNITFVDSSAMQPLSRLQVVFVMAYMISIVFNLWLASEICRTINCRIFRTIFFLAHQTWRDSICTKMLLHQCLACSSKTHPCCKYCLIVWSFLPSLLIISTYAIRDISENNIRGVQVGTWTANLPSLLYLFERHLGTRSRCARK